MELLKKDAVELADFLSLLADYLRDDPHAAKSIMEHAAKWEAKLRAE